MKKKLLDLGLPENVVEDILSVYHTHEQTLEAYEKPGGPAAFEKNLGNIEKLSQELADEMQKLTAFERQQLLHCGAGDIRKTAAHIKKLAACCGFAKGKELDKQNFSRKEPFLRQLGIEIKATLEHHGFPVKVYRRNMFCLVLDILLRQGWGQTSLTLLRQINKNPL